MLLIALSLSLPLLLIPAVLGEAIAVKSFENDLYGCFDKSLKGIYLIHAHDHFHNNSFQYNHHDFYR